MIHIDDGNIDFAGNLNEVVSDLGMFWFAFEYYPHWWEEMRRIVIPSLIETINMTDEQIEFLTELRKLCDKHPHMFKSYVQRDGNVQVGKLKFEGGEK